MQGTTVRAKQTLIWFTATQLCSIQELRVKFEVDHLA